MMVLVTYDVAITSNGGVTRLRKISKQCCNFGQRVQNSVFECVVDPLQFEELKYQLLRIMDEEHDSVRFYFLGSQKRHRIEHYGVTVNVDVEDTLIL